MKNFKRLLWALFLLMAGSLANPAAGKADTGISVITSSPTPGILEVQTTNLPAEITELQIPIWSEKNGQDDLQWYTAAKTEEGVFSLHVNLKQHHFETGTYHIHLYGKKTADTQLQGLLATSTQVTSQAIPEQRPNITVSNINLSNGSYTLTVQETEFSKLIKSVQVASWSGDHTTIKWYDAASNGQGEFTVMIDFRNHKKTKGIYTNHIYVTYADGNRGGYVAEQVDLSNVQLPVTVVTQLVKTGTYAFTADNITNTAPISYAVWSDTNGQDDLQWYSSSQRNNDIFSGEIPLSNHKGTGLYHLHIYQEGRGLAAAAFQVKQSDIQTVHYITTSNTYPVGQCTWGAKELAPWAGNWWGNGGQWAASAKKAGFQVGTAPQVGAIICWTDGGYGHVAVVTDVQSDTRIQVKEANYAGKQYIANFRGWFNPHTAGQGTVSYIYPK